MIRYQAKIVKDEDGYLVTFPDLPGCFSCGDTLEEAKYMASEALSLYLEDARDPKWEVPKAKSRRGKFYYWIMPDISVAISLMLRKSRQEAGLTQAQLARRLNMKTPQVQRLEMPGKSNPTVKTLANISRELGISFEIGSDNRTTA